MHEIRMRCHYQAHNHDQVYSIYEHDIKSNGLILSVGAYEVLIMSLRARKMEHQVVAVFEDAVMNNIIPSDLMCTMVCQSYTDETMLTQNDPKVILALMKRLMDWSVLTTKQVGALVATALKWDLPSLGFDILKVPAAAAFVVVSSCAIHLLVSVFALSERLLEYILSMKEAALRTTSEGVIIMN
jgi:hypothetical protein